VDDNAKSDRNGMEELVGLFDDASGSSKDSTMIDSANNNATQLQVHMSDLSQVAYEKANEVILSLEQDHSRRKLVERSCPNWKENIAFCMKQTKDDVQLALDQVRRKRKEMLEWKSNMLEAWERQETVLCFFEQGLRSSLTRFGPCHSADESDCEAYQGWFENNIVGNVGEEGFDLSWRCRNEDDHDSKSSDHDNRVRIY
jgi:hypothetical protein